MRIYCFSLNSHHQWSVLDGPASRELGPWCVPPGDSSASLIPSPYVSWSSVKNSCPFSLFVFNGFGRLFISVWTHGYSSYSLSYPARTVVYCVAPAGPAVAVRSCMLAVSSDTPHPFCSASSVAAQDGPGSSCVFCLSCGIRHFFMEPWLLFMVIELIFNRRAKAIQRGEKCIFSK